MKKLLITLTLGLTLLSSCGPKEQTAKEFNDELNIKLEREWDSLQRANEKAIRSAQNKVDLLKAKAGTK